MPAPPRILIHIDHNPHPRVFDRIMSLDGGADQILAYGDVDPQDVPVLVSGALYSRPLAELHRTALLVTGTNDRVIAEMVRQAKRAFFGAYRVSVLSECKGGNAVAGAAVARIGRLVALQGLPVLVVAGGPAGARVAGLLSRAGADVTLTVFDDEEAADRGEFIEGTFARPVKIVVWKAGEPLDEVLDGQRLLVSAGPPELTLVPRRVWSRFPSLMLLVDVSGAEPPGIEGLSGEEDGDPIDDPARDGPPVRALGGLAISRYKIQVHREAVRRLFEPEAVVMGTLEIARLAEEVVAGG
ncbi:MAG TPA: methylene-tetrahydromethanopterin dehydrogenase N-terminal domain-containing protein [Gemmatimonadota bacterium]|nr:methylene-tetrahydromethanopterin dehydrogenase N-terminal domain-containing protein [Gemmatimonadota bacterium]